MTVHTDFTSGKHTLIFSDGNEIELTKQESIEFEKWYESKSSERK